MRIIIPTKGRLSSQLTLNNLPKKLWAMTTLVCPEAEARRFRLNYLPVSSDAYTDDGPLEHGLRVVAQPDPNMGIAQKRKWIVETSADHKIVMLDDDLRFAVRRTDDPAKFRQATQEDITGAFRELENILGEETPHAGFAARGAGIGEAAQRGGWQEAKRMMYVLGYYVPTVLAHAEFGRMGTHEDMDICLQLLTKGFPNRVNFSFVVDQKFGNKGGCTDERTLEKNNADALELARLFPTYVRATEKTYAGSPNRVEVVCAWQKALKDGLINRQ